ncbi:DUF4747 family protein [Sphingomonas aerolata]|uniref:DUF4747 family protein n=1 Tax=Sphingomonas aerolata TaxID=185951 RepID=UPI002FE2C960
MAQRMKVEAGALNVRTHPHDDENYRELFRAAFALKKPVKIRGDRHGLIASLQRIGQEDEIVNGVLTTFIELDLKGAWLNTETLAEASNNELEEIVVPDYLRPNLMAFRFAFDIKNHEIIFEHYGDGNRLTHASAESFFSRLLSDKKIKKRFGDVKVAVVQSKGSVDRIFSIPRITEIEAYIEKPNADVWDGGFEGNAEDHLDEKNARSMLVRYKAERGGGIRRDDDLDALVRASIRNGRTVAKGYGPEGHMVVTTERYPRVEQEKYNPDDLSNVQVFARLVHRFRRR